MAKIIVIEDNRDLNYAYRLILQKAGHEARSAHCADEGLALLETFEPELVLLDLLMPKKSGVDFLRSARLPKRYPKVKVIIFTNLDRGTELDAARRYGDFMVAIKAHTTPGSLVQEVDRLLTAS
jgi:DNA-binding response OmpR family regulator